MQKLAPYWKAVLGFVTPGVVALVAAVGDASPGGSTVTGPEWVGIGAACILTGASVYAAANAPTPTACTFSTTSGRRPWANGPQVERLV